MKSQTKSDQPPGIGGKVNLSALFRRYGIVIILVAMIVLLLVASPTFRTLQNAVNVLQQISVNGILAMGMTFVICVAGIDLSIGSLIAVSSVICGAVLSANPANIPLAVLLSVLVCGAFGLFNGFFIARFNLFPFVVTLASLMISRAVAYIISDGQSFVLESPGFKAIGQGKLFGMVPYGVIIFLVVTTIAYVLLARTKFGRYVYATGGNIRAAIASGVNVFAVKVAVYSMMGVCAAIAGIILSSRVNAGQPSIGVGYEQDAIAACVIGGTSLNGGVGTIFGTFIGVIMIGVINNGMNLLGVSSYYQQMVKGAIILGAVLLDQFIGQKRGN